jgi:hypothetical protein
MIDAFAFMQGEHQNKQESQRLAILRSREFQTSYTMYLNELLLNLPVQYHSTARSFLRPFMSCTYGDTETAPDKAWYFDHGVFAVGFGALALAKTDDGDAITERRRFCAAIAQALEPSGDPIGRLRNCPKIWRKYAESAQCSPSDRPHIEREIIELVEAMRGYLLVEKNGELCTRDECRPSRLRRATCLRDLERDAEYGLEGIAHTWSIESTFYVAGGVSEDGYRNSQGGWAQTTEYYAKVKQDSLLLSFDFGKVEYASSIDLARNLYDLMRRELCFVFSMEYGRVELIFPGKTPDDVHVVQHVGPMLQSKWDEGYTEWARSLFPGYLPWSEGKLLTPDKAYQYGSR